MCHIEGGEETLSIVESHPAATPRPPPPPPARICIDNRRQCGSFLIYGLLCWACGSVAVGHQIALAAIYVSAVSQIICYFFIGTERTVYDDRSRNAAERWR